MNKTTLKTIKEQYWQNVQDMERCEEEVTYDELERENETIEWICKLEGKEKEIKDWKQKCAISIQIMDEEL